MALEDLIQLWAGGSPWADQLAEWTAARQAALPDLNRRVAEFLAGEISLADFSRSVDRFGKRSNLWGYSGHSGQMFLNVLMRSADHARLEEELRFALVLPYREDDAEDRIDRFIAFVQETQARAALLERFAPKAGYAPFFLSFFWEAQSLNWPIYYPSSRRALTRHGLFRETGPFSQRYITFRREIIRLRDSLRTTTWGVEVLLFNIAREEETPSRGARSPAPSSLAKQRPSFDLLIADDETLERANEREQLDLILDELAAANERISLSRAEQTSSWRDVQSYLEAISLGLDTDLIPLPRFIDLTIYASEAETAAEVEEATLGLIDALGFALSDEFPPVRSSFFRRFFARTREVMSRPEVAVRLGEGERALQIRGVDLPQAQVDALQAEAAAKLIQSLDGQRKATVKIGSLLLLKAEEQLIVTTLTPTEMLNLSRRPTLLNSPGELLGVLRPDDAPELPPGDG